MIVNYLATYPKCGNSALAFPLILAGQLADSSYEGWDSLSKVRRAHLQDNSLPFKAIRGADTTVIKTHKIFKGSKDLTTPQGDVSKVIRITRNPFDCLLSALNFLRLEANSSRSLAMIRPTVEALFPNHKLIRRWTSPNQFFNRFTIDSLAKENLLDLALESFSRLGLTLPFYYSVCGGWRTNYESWGAAKVPVLDLRYEDLVPTPSVGTIQLISNFLGADEELLSKAFEIQMENVHHQRKKGNPFFNQANKSYFSRYFSKKALRHFVDYNQVALQAMGYEELSQEINI